MEKPPTTAAKITIKIIDKLKKKNGNTRSINKENSKLGEKLQPTRKKWWKLLQSIPITRVRSKLLYYSHPFSYSQTREHKKEFN